MDWSTVHYDDEGNTLSNNDRNFYPKNLYYTISINIWINLLYSCD